YEYNALGEQIAQRDTFEDRTTIAQWRDARGRVYQQTTSRDSGETVLHQYQFDSASPGQLSVESSSGAYQAFEGEAGSDVDFRRSFNYDTLGRVIGSTTTVAGIAYHALTQYDDLGRAWRSQDPSDAWLKTEFDARGYAVRLCDSSAGDSTTTCASGSAGTWRETLLTDARGNVLAERRGGSDALGLVRFFEDSTGRLLSQCAGGNCNLLDEDYTWDAAGNLRARDKAGQYREVFSYDALNRLTQSRYERIGSVAYGPDTGPLSSAQSYDKLGNLCSKLIAGAVRDYRYGGLAGCGLGGLAGAGGDFGPDASPHAVIQANGGSFQYDSHGNQTEASYSDIGRNRSIDYSAADQAVQIRIGNAFAPSLRTRFWYGSDGSRYQREDTAQAGSTKRTLYIGNLEIVSQGGITTTKRYVAGVLVQDMTSSGTTSQFLFHDHIGSVVRAVSASGVVLEGMDYGAFGERRGYTDPTLAALVPRTTPRGFTGHEMIDGTDVIHMNGRIYDSALGRFLQADPIIQEPNNPQNFNRYSYVLNNPLSLTDPSGFLFGGIGKAFRRALAGVLRNIPIPSENPFTRLLGTIALNLLANLIEPGTGSGGVRGAFSNVAVSGFAQRPGDIGTAGGTAGSDGGFGHGFVQAGFFAGIASGSVTGDDVAAVTQDVLIAGTDSEQTGGKFGNGAGTATSEFALGLLAGSANSTIQSAAFTVGTLSLLSGNIPSALLNFQLSTTELFSRPDSNIGQLGFDLGPIVPITGFAGSLRAISIRALRRVAAREMQVVVARGATFGEKILKQLPKRGFTQEEVLNLIRNPSRTLATRDTRHLPGGGRLNDPATVFFDDAGNFVVRNNKTGDIVQISDKTNPNFIPNFPEP
ncbi:MAG: colicin E5-related ribonuclease, partial [Erythrobacter sp.]|nr:colicin E5-related ribonuclease [Erythrobacter sp.]